MESDLDPFARDNEGYLKHFPNGHTMWHKNLQKYDKDNKDRLDYISKQKNVCNMFFFFILICRWYMMVPNFFLMVEFNRLVCICLKAEKMNKFAVSIILYADIIFCATHYTKIF